MLCAWALSACGGGGGSSMSLPPAPPPPAVDVSGVTAVDPGTSLPADWQHGVFMEIFVRSYRDSDGDGKGDLQGLISELPYLQSLGVKGLWLMPVTASSDHDHGYAVANYRDIEPDYGTLADLDELVSKAHLAGIGVVIDYVMNHSSNLNPVFANSAYSATNAYRDWYIWQSTAPTGWNIFGGNPWHTAANGAYFGVFSPTMPDWNLNNPLVVAYHEANLRFWLNRGVDGFRFDAVGNLYENGPTAWADQPQDYALMAEMHLLLAGYTRRNSYMVCEDPGNPQAAGNIVVGVGGCGGAFAFDLKNALIGAAKNDATSIAAVASYFTTAPPGMAPVLANHDSFAGDRVWTQLAGNQLQYKLAAASYLLAPGTPFMYYGEEVGMANAAALADDGKLRTPMSWTATNIGVDGFTTGTPYRALSANVANQNVAAEDADPSSLLNFYRAMLTLRNTRPSIRDGSYVQPQVGGSVLSYQRQIAGETTLAVINYGTASASVDITGLPASATLHALFPATGSADVTTDTGGTARFDSPSSMLAPQSVLVFDVSPPL
jgi:glycosidase